MKPITSKIRRALFVVLAVGTLVALTCAYVCAVAVSVGAAAQPSPEPWLLISALGVMAMLTLRVLPFGRVIEGWHGRHGHPSAG